jgi:integrase
MARKIRDAKLESRSARLRLPTRKKPYTGPSLARGIMLLYRRNRTNGTWVVKAANGHRGYWTKGFAVADDFEDADGTHVLTFHQAGDAGKALARGKADTTDSKPMTVADAIARYKIDLKNRGGHLTNATRVEKYLTSTLAGKPVGLLTVRDLRTWRDGLIDKMEPSSVNRTRTGLRAALELAATLDHRITNRHVFRLGLRGLPGSNKARRIVLPDADVLRVVNASYEINPTFGLLVEVLAVTGARVSQVARLTCADVQGDRSDPRLMMPSSFKGRGQKTITHRPVPITPALAARLKDAKGNRPDAAPLLRKRDGSAWQATSTVDHRDLFRSAVERAELDPNEITSYALRHSSIVRALLGGVPVAVAAQQHDTSVREIEAHYAAYILDHSDALSRRVLLDTAHPVAADLEGPGQPPAAEPGMHLPDWKGLHYEQ